MKVMIFSDFFPPNKGGIETSIVTFMRALCDRVEFFVVAPNYRAKRLLSLPRNMGNLLTVPTLRLPIRAKGMSNFDFYLALPLASIGSVFRVGISFRPDVIHVHSPFGAGIAGVVVSRVFGIPMIYTYHTFYERDFSRYAPIMSSLVFKAVLAYHLWFARRAEVVIAPTESVKAYLESFAPSVKIDVCPTGIDTKKFKNASRERGRRFLGVDEESFLALYLGRINKEKGVFEVIRAFRMFKEMVGGRDAKLALVGPGVHSGLIDTGSGDIILKGEVDPSDVPDIMACADVYLFGSRRETQGLTALEAMGAGTPVIALRGPGVVHFIRDGENGYLVETVEEMAQRIRELYEDRMILKEMSEKAKLTAEEFSIEKTAERLLSIYRTARRVKKRPTLRKAVEKVYAFVENFPLAARVRR